jgi:hypothetical protein
MTTRPPEFVGLAYIRDARAYLKAATLLPDSDVAMFSPVYFLLCHGIELAQKAFILASGGSEKELRDWEIRHHIDKLRERAGALGYKPCNEKIDAIIDWLAPFHADHSFRYRDPKGFTQYPSVADTIEALTSMLDQIEPVVRKVVLDAMR